MISIVPAAVNFRAGGQPASVRVTIRRLSPRLAKLAFVTLLASLGLARDNALAGWSQATVVDESKTCDVDASAVATAFDARGVLWAACQPHGAAGGLIVGRLTSLYRLTATRRIPGTQGVEVDPYSISLSVNKSGVAALAWSSTERGDPFGGDRILGAAVWRLGYAPRKVIEMPAQEPRNPRVAINERGTAIVAYAIPNITTRVSGWAIDAALMRIGSFLGVSQLATTNEEEIDHVEAFARRDGDFNVSWQPIREERGELEPRRMTTAMARVSDDGTFTRPVFDDVFPLSPARRPLSGSISTNEALLSNEHGDQVVTWTSQGVSALDGSEPSIVNVYVASRRAGHPFGAPRIIGQQAERGGSPRTVIDPSGRLTVVWEATSKRIRTATGTAGGSFGAPQTIASVSDSRELTLGLTSSNHRILVWRNVFGLHLNGKIEAATSNVEGRFTKRRVISETNTRITDCAHPYLTVGHGGGMLAEWTCLRAKSGHATAEFAYYRP